MLFNKDGYYESITNREAIIKLPKIFFLCIGLFISGEITAAARAPMAIPAITLIWDERRVDVMNVEDLADLRMKALEALGQPQDMPIDFILPNRYILKTGQSEGGFERFRTSSEMPGVPRPRLDVFFPTH